MKRQREFDFGDLDEYSESSNSKWLPWAVYAARGYDRPRLPETADEVLAYVVGSGGKGVAVFDGMNPGRFVALAALLHYGVRPEAVLEAQNRINASQWLHEELGIHKKAINVTRDDIERVLDHVRTTRQLE